MLVDQVQRVARELDAAGLLALAEERVVAACNSPKEIRPSAGDDPYNFQSNSIAPSLRVYLFLPYCAFLQISFSICHSLQRERGKVGERRTADLPDEVLADVVVVGGHCVDDCAG